MPTRQEWSASSFSNSGTSTKILFGIGSPILFSEEQTGFAQDMFKRLEVIAMVGDISEMFFNFDSGVDAFLEADTSKNNTKSGVY